MLLIISLISFSFVSCKLSKEDSEILKINLSSKIESHNNNLSRISDSIRYIWFENSDLSYIAEVSLLRVSKNYIVVYDRILNNLLLFDRSGNFLQSVGKYLNNKNVFKIIYDIDISPDESMIIALVQDDKSILFDLCTNHCNTQFIDKKVEKIRFLDNNNIVLYISKVNRFFYDGNVFFLLNIHGGVKKAITIDEIDAKRFGTGIGGFNTLSHYGKDLVLWEFLMDTVYTLTEGFDIKPRFEINYGSERITQDCFTDIKKLNACAQSGKLAITNIVETKKFVFLEGVTNRQRILFGFDKDDRLLYDFSGKLRIGFTNDLDNQLPFWPEGTTDSLTIYRIAYPSEMIEHKKKFPDINRVKMETKISDNPFLIMVFLK